MGLFDVNVNQSCKSQKEALALQKNIETTLNKEGFEQIKDNEQTIIKYQAPKALLKYHLSFIIEKNNLIVQGELQQTLIIAILIILAILLTYGIGVILVVGYVYYQRIFTSKALKVLIKQSQGT